MSFTPDISKQAQEVIFSWKSHKFTYPSVFFNNSAIVTASNQKLLGVYVDEKPNFNEYFEEKIARTSKGISLIEKLQNKLPSNALLTIYKTFIRPQLD